MKRSLKFSVENIEVYESRKNARFSKVKIRCFSDGENIHTEDISIDALKNSADSIYDIPLICELNPYRNKTDFGGHGVLTGKQFSFGFVKEEKDNPIVFEREEGTGKTFLTIIGTIWNKYSFNVLDILKNKNGKAEVSVELTCIEGCEDKLSKKINMKRWVFDAITFLGDITTAACPNAHAQLQFSKAKKEYLGEDIVFINNTQNTNVEERTWINPRNKLLVPILKASNKNELLKEAYLKFDENKEIGLSTIHYPHHQIDSIRNELQISVDGLMQAFSQACKDNVMDEDIKNHLLRHFEELSLTEEVFANYGLEKEFSQYFAQDFRKEEGMYEENNLEEKFAEDETLEDKAVTENEENKEDNEDVRMEEEDKCDEKEDFASEEHEDNDDTEDVDDADDTDDTDDKEADDKEDVQEEEMSTDDGVPPVEDRLTYEELEVKLSVLEQEKITLEEKLFSMLDYEDLKAFKEEVEFKMAQEKDMVEMTKVMEQLTDKGIAMSEDAKKELFEKRQEFPNINAWSNYVKAFAFDNLDTSDGIVKMELPNITEKESKSTGVWASLMNKFNN